MAPRFRQGITPVVSIVLLLMVGIGIIAAVFAFTTGLLGEYIGDAQQSSRTELTVRDVDTDAARVYVANTGDSNVTPEFAADSADLSQVPLSPRETTPLSPGSGRWFQLGCLPQGATTLLVRDGNTEYARSLGSVPEQYCIEVTDTYIETDGFETYRVFEGRVRLNNDSQEPYANRELEYRFDGEANIIETDSEGKFTFQRDWGTDTIPPYGMWSKTVTYESETPLINFHGGRGYFQPPNDVRINYEDGGTEVHRTQQVMQEQENSKFELFYEILPKDITADDVTLTVSMRVDPKQGLADDWDAHPDAKLLHQLAFGARTPVSWESCSASPGVTCDMGEPALTADNNVRDERFDEADLPENEDGEKYVPFHVEMSASQQDTVSLLSLNHYFEQENRLSHMRNRNRPFYIPQGSTVTAWADNLTLPYLENEVTGQLSDDDATLNRTYAFRSHLAASPHGWGRPPYTRRMYSYWALNTDPSRSSNNPTSDSFPSVLYEWSEADPDETYTLNVTLTVERGTTDQWFDIPIAMGTFGLFPPDGGPAHTVYRRGGIRYPEFGWSGRYNARIRIPGSSGGTRAMVYKITEPLDNDRWRATTYVLNTDEESIDNIYLLNARGEWNEFEETADGDNRLDAGETHTGTFSVDARDDELVQLNTQFQMITTGATAPEYDGWWYRWNLTVSNDTATDTYNMSDTTRCILRYCLTYRTANREEAAPINNLRNREGEDAPKSRFTDLDEASFELANAEESNGGASLRLKLMKFWTWYLEPFNDDLEGDLSINPDQLQIETLEHDPYRKGTYREVFQ